jgi:iron complex transport system ATP-binding protein
MSFLCTQELWVQVGKRQLVRNLNLEINRGEFWCVLGRNGVGKTSLLHTLAGLLPPGSGKVLVEGGDIATMPAITLARKRGMLMQKQVDAFGHTVLDSVLIGRTPYRAGKGWDSEDDFAAASAALQTVGLPDRAGDDVQHLSGGERQRVALAALLAQAPDLMLMDEPTSHQDVAQQLAVMRLVRKLAEIHAVIVNCHDIQLASRFATHVLLLAPDRFWHGPVAEVLRIEALEQAFDCRFHAVADENGTRFTAY